jgi:hypothetical protein
MGVGRNGRNGSIVTGRLWRRFSRLGCGERYGVVLSWIEKLPMLGCVAIMPGGIWGLSRSIGAPRRLGRLGLGGAAHRDWVCIWVEELALLFNHGYVWWGFWSGGKFEDARELARVWLGPTYKHRRWRLAGGVLRPARR